MDWFNLALDLLVPLIMIGIGLSFLKKPPKDINGAYGYRTPMSMKNQDTWDFAHRVCGRVWCIAGAGLVEDAAVRRGEQGLFDRGDHRIGGRGDAPDHNPGGAGAVSSI